MKTILESMNEFDLPLEYVVFLTRTRIKNKVIP